MEGEGLFINLREKKWHIPSLLAANHLGEIDPHVGKVILSSP